ncbi:hypothetical protein SF06_32350 [Pseudomonas flexibilis]|nr:hypothetical protein SF06_32350 [Pseudomonas flexibilis]
MADSQHGQFSSRDRIGLLCVGESPSRPPRSLIRNKQSAVPQPVRPWSEARAVGGGGVARGVTAAFRQGGRRFPGRRCGLHRSRARWPTLSRSPMRIAAKPQGSGCNEIAVNPDTGRCA